MNYSEAPFGTLRLISGTGYRKKRSFLAMAASFSK
jgi:hypothetical protein